MASHAQRAVVMWGLRILMVGPEYKGVPLGVVFSLHHALLLAQGWRAGSQVGPTTCTHSQGVIEKQGSVE
jgi:hypothetical protein